jgi:two-component system sensor histidine kinase/response regulator
MAVSLAARRGRQPGQERLPGQHEPRDPHADERHHRPDPPAAARRRDARAARTAGQDRRRRRSTCCAIINDILDLSKIEAGKLQLEQHDFRSRRCSTTSPRSSANGRAGQGPAHRCRHERRAAWLRGDPTRLRQALLNYAGNAVKFTEQGSVTLRARLLDEHGDDDRLLVRFEVEDTGIGIAPDKLARCSSLRAGRRLDHAQATAAPASAWPSRAPGATDGRRSRRRQHAGRRQHLLVHARCNAGRAPCPPPRPRRRPPDAERAAPRHARRPRAAGRRQPDQPRSGAGTAARRGLAVDTAEDGREALAMARAPYDLILMDMQMPTWTAWRPPAPSAPCRRRRPRRSWR